MKRAAMRILYVQDSGTARDDDLAHYLRDLTDLQVIGAQEPVLSDASYSLAFARNEAGLLHLNAIEARGMNGKLPVVLLSSTGNRNAAENSMGVSHIKIVDVIQEPLDFQEVDRILNLYANSVGFGSVVKEKLPDIFFPTVFFLLFIAAWQGICRFFQVKEYILPPPSAILNEFMEKAGSLAFDVIITSTEAFLGFLIANLLSITIAVVFSFSPKARKTLYPYLIALKSVPIVAVAPLLVIWIGYGMTSKVLMAAMVAFFPLVVNCTVGLLSAPQEAEDLMKSFGANKWQILIKLRFPVAMPFIVSALKISAALSVVGAIVAELTGARMGIGFTILMASYNIDTPLLFAAIIAASVIGILFFGLICLIEIIFLKRFIYEAQIN